jgi:hypothetical protein
VLDEQFAAEHTKIFERDKANAREITLQEWRRRPLDERILGGIGVLFRSQL